jgi:arsenite-transporting ATPase
VTKHLFFSGKGGVGKTTMASATAIHHAKNGRKTLIVTTDPASNLADVYEQNIGHKVTPIKSIDNLFAMEIDPDEATREYKERIIGPFRGIMPDDVIESLEENLSGGCTTEMASFDRFVDFMETDEYDVVVLDTAPTGHTIRLLELPVDWSKHIEESAKGSGQTCLGPVQSIQQSKDKYDRAIALLRDESCTTFIFVMKPDELSLYETLRASNELENIGITSNEIIINGILPQEVCNSTFFHSKYDAQQDIIDKCKDSLNKPSRLIYLKSDEVKGIAALQDIANELHDISPASANANTYTANDAGSISQSYTYKFLNMHSPIIENFFIPENGTRALFFTGKGGVGKTTISCITALHIADKGNKTLLVTTDPAAHIGEVLDKKVGTEPAMITDNLFAVMIDQEETFEQYKSNILDDAQGKYSSDMLTAMEEELNSPCIEEMAAFEQFAQFLETEEYDVIIFDTAPTGHTLRLLELPFDYAKQVEIMAQTTAENSAIKNVSRERFTKMIDRLRNPTKSVFSLVLYPEATPIEEAYRAMLDLKNAGIETQLVIANMVLPEEICTNDFFKKRMSMQIKYLQTIHEKFNLPVLRFPLMENEVKGIEALKNSLKES